MAIFLYSAADKEGKKKKGLLRADGYSEALKLLESRDFASVKVKPYCKAPDLTALAVFSIFIFFVVFAAVALFSSRREDTPVVPALLILVFIAAAVTALFRLYLRQTLPSRTMAHLDEGEKGEAYFIDALVSGEFLPEEEPGQVLVHEDGVNKQKILTGRIERSGLPNYLHLFICLAGYYIPALLAWSILPPDKRTAAGQTLPAWGLSFGLSLMVVPVLIFTLSMKLRREIVASCAAIAAILHLLLLKNAYMKDPATALVYEIISSNPVHSIIAWAIPAAIMIFMEKNRKIKDILKLEYPLYE